MAHKPPKLVIETALTVTIVLVAFSSSNFRRSVVHNAELFMQFMIQDRKPALQSYLASIEAAILTNGSVPLTAKAMKDLGVTWGTRGGAGEKEVQNLSMFASAASPYDVHFERNHPAVK
ncbi:hypothetical protein METH_14530 [Leisingera methylohalidivorans DSM 14336]|uniref:Uncharacterized protein n=1 Tax=Leisingera methylohalidivorans DSM 14336 TaxID=999552 RepID=V9W1U6_9RHOB|nr:hypothetical protein METH_14530 [Leisingera methylohalidivorans DSM 14336]